jgi:hypothetical protein
MGNLEDLKKQAVDLKQEFDTLFKRRTEETYEIEVSDTKFLTKMNKVIKSNLEWTGADSIGYTNVVHTFEKETEGMKVEDSKLNIKAYLIEGLFFMLSRYKGVGYNTAKEFAEVMQPIQKTVSLLRADDEKLKQLREQIGEIEMQISMIENPEEEMINEEMIIEESSPNLD